MYKQNISITIHTVKGLVNIPIENLVEFYFTEDIFAALITGKLTFYDRTGLLERTQFSGREIIYIKYGENEEYNKLFVIYNVVNVKGRSAADNLNTVTLYLVEADYINLIQNSFSKSWSDKKISTIVKEIYTKMVIDIPFVQFEESKEKIDFCMPYWSPLESIKWLMKRASGVETGTAGYLFYTNSKGKNFVTLEKLFRQKVSEKIKGENAQYIFNATDTSVDYLNKILYWETTGPDLQSTIRLQGGTKLGFDFETKSLLSYEYKYSDIVSKYTMFGKKTLFPNISNPKIRMDLECDNDINVLKNLAYSEFIKRYTKQFQVKIVVRGHEKRYAGSMIDIQWKSANPEEKMHNALDGKYLVVSIVHQFNPYLQPTWKSMMTLIKNAYGDMSINFLQPSTIKAGLE